METPKDRCAFVTGGSRGIGSAIARRLAADGFRVVFTYLTAAEAADRTRLDIERAGGWCMALRADVADPRQMRNSIERAVAALGGIDVLVNNAGIIRTGSLQEMNVEDIDHMIGVNVAGALYTCRAAIPHLRSGGRIISIGSSLADHVWQPRVTAYAMTKAALSGLTRGLARDLADRSISVTLIQPGATDTDMNPANAARADRQRAAIPLARYADPSEVAALASFLASPEASHMSGSTITVDGAQNA